MKIQLSDLNESIRKIPLPQNMLDRPVSRQGYPVPFFAGRVNGEWDFRVTHPGTTIRCLKEKLCWVCGKSMGSKLAFVVGPMCVITRTSAEPPSHYTCAVYSATACPFLASPRMRRNEVELPAGHLPPPGTAIMRNPGCAAVLVTNSYKPFNDGEGGLLIEMGKPEAVLWYARRGNATFTDVMTSIASGITELYKACETEDSPRNKEEAYDELLLRVGETLKWLPSRVEGESPIEIPPPPVPVAG